MAIPKFLKMLSGRVQEAAMTSLEVTDTLGYVPLQGPATSTDHALARFDGTDGKTANDSTTHLSDAGWLTVGATSAPSAPLTVVGDATTSAPTYGAELLSSSGWTKGSGWTGDFASGFAHSSGTATLSNSFAPTVGLRYSVYITVTGRTAGSFAVNFGGISPNKIAATGAFGMGGVALTTAGLVVTPTTDFNGTMVISIKEITAANGTVAALGNTQFRDGTSGTSLLIGTSAALYTARGASSNLALGYGTLGFNIGGAANAVCGTNAMANCENGYGNLAFGTSALMNGDAPYLNTAVGANTLANCNGSGNLGLGYTAGSSLTTGGYNVAIGYNAQLPSNTADRQTNINGQIYGWNTGATTRVAIGSSTDDGVNALQVAGSMIADQYMGIEGSATWNAGSIAANSYTSTTITATGAALGDFVLASASAALDAGTMMSAEVTSANTVTIKLHNLTGSAIDPASKTYYVRVLRK